MSAPRGLWKVCIYRLFTDDADALHHAARLCAAGYRVSVRHPDQYDFLSKPVLWAEQWETRP